MSKRVIKQHHLRLVAPAIPSRKGVDRPRDADGREHLAALMAAHAARRTRTPAHR